MELKGHPAPLIQPTSFLKQLQKSLLDLALATQELWTKVSQPTHRIISKAHIQGICGAFDGSAVVTSSRGNGDDAGQDAEDSEGFHDEGGVGGLMKET